MEHIRLIPSRPHAVEQRRMVKVSLGITRYNSVQVCIVRYIIVHHQYRTDIHVHGVHGVRGVRIITTPDTLRIEISRGCHTRTRSP
jgi:hypothetical protein